MQQIGGKKMKKLSMFGSLLLILAFVLGPYIEEAFRQTMIISRGNMLFLVQRPICAVLLLIALAVVVMSIVGKRTFSNSVSGED